MCSLADYCFLEEVKLADDIPQARAVGHDSPFTHAMHCRADYRFLEEVKLADDVAKRSRPPAPKQELPPFLQTLIYQARRLSGGKLALQVD